MAACLHRPACLEQRRGEQLRRGDACPVTGVHLVHRYARHRPGQLKLAARRRDLVPGGDHHRGGDIDLADPARRGEPADGPDGRDRGGQGRPAQLGACPPACGRVVKTPRSTSPKTSALIRCRSGFHCRAAAIVGAARAASCSAVNRWEMRSPARSRAPNALAPLPGRRQVRPVVKYHVPEIPDREVQFADGLLDFPGRTVIADQPRHGLQR